jgi:hypothetical protein
MATTTFALVGGVFFLVLGLWLSVRKRELHPILLLSVCAAAFSWIEAPYDWAVYANFDPSWPRMPSWWPMNMTWGGLPFCVPFGYIAYFVLPAVIGAWLGRKLATKHGWRLPQTLIYVGLAVGIIWAFIYNFGMGVLAETTKYGYVIPGLAIFEGGRNQYPLYDALAMGIQMMVFTYLLGRRDAEGRNVITAWAAKRTNQGWQAIALSLVAVIVVGHVVYGAVFAPHLVTKLAGWMNSGPTEEWFPGYENQPLHGGSHGGPIPRTTPDP